MANILRVSFDSQDEWPIKDVTVYDETAQTVRILEYKTTDAGEAELKLTNLPRTIKPESIRAEVSSLNASVLEVTSEVVTGVADPIRLTPRETEIGEIIKNLQKEFNTNSHREQVLESYYQNMVPGAPTVPSIMPQQVLAPVQSPFANLFGFGKPKKKKKTRNKNIEAKLERLLKPNTTNNVAPIPPLDAYDLTPTYLQRNTPPVPQRVIPTFPPPVEQQQSSLPVINFTDEEQNELFEQMGSQENLEQFSQALDTYFEEITKLRKRKNQIEKEVKVLTSEKALIYAEKIRKAEEMRKVTTEVSVLVHIPEETVVETGIVEVKLIYVVNNCKWRASYDVRVSKEDRMVELAYFGKVTNNSGEDWREVQLYLSTAKPSRAGTLPFLPRANVRYIQKRRQRKYKKEHNQNLNDLGPVQAAAPPRYEQRRLSLAMPIEDFDTEEVEQELEEIAKVDQSVAKDRGGSATFKLNRLCSIESDNIPHKQKISNVTLTPRFTYVMTPKLTPFAYLMCTARNDSSFVFVRGPMSVFFNGSYVTKSTMKLVNKNQEFKVFLGKDETVKLNITPAVSKKEVTKGGIMTSKTNKETFTRTVKVDNTGEEDIEVMLYEQVPLSRDNKIKVEILKPNVEGNKKCKINHFNHLELKRKMKAGKSWNFVYSYQVEWPKNSEIIYTESLENLQR